MKSVIVTGGTGFIGGWLIHYLLSQGIRVCAVVRSKNRLLAEFSRDKNFCIIEKNYADLSPNDFPHEHWDCFYHMAWEGVSSEQKNDYDIQLKNVLMALRVMDLSGAIDCEKFISAGTVAEYVFCDGMMDFSQKQSPNDFYGAAKVATHYFLDVQSSRLGVPYIWAVLPSTFGERRSDNNIITYTIKSLLSGEIPQYGSLDQMWDFLHVSEVVRALYLIGEKGSLGKTYGIGSGDHRKLRDYIVTVRDMINPELPLGIGSIKHNTKQLTSSCVDISELTRDTGFIPEVRFEEGIKRTISFIKDNM